MGVDQLLSEVQKLSLEEKEEFFFKLNAANEAQEIEETPELLAAIDEGLRSLREEGSIPIEQVIEEFKTWHIKSP